MVHNTAIYVQFYGLITQPHLKNIHFVAARRLQVEEWGLCTHAPEQLPCQKT